MQCFRVAGWYTVLMLTVLAPVARADVRLDAYAFPTSVVQGDSVWVFVSTDASAFDLRIQRDAAIPVIVLTVENLPGRSQIVPRNAPENGCSWSASYGLRIPPTWPSGVYICELSVGGRTAGHAIFTLRERVPGSTARILFQNSIATWQAYNAWGGRSLYNHNSDSSRAHVVSLRRPHKLNAGLGDYPDYERFFVHWLASEGIPVEFCTDLDTHADSTLLGAYSLFLAVGHDEYWSWEQRQQVERFVARGGNVGIFSGNTCWWQIRISPQLDRIICYKDKNLDPLAGIDPARTTVLWYADPVRRPENSTIGVSWRNGGYVNAAGWLPASQGYGGYTAYDTGHWVFAGTGLADGQEFGQPSTIVGFEADGALFTWIDGLPVPTGTDTTPLSFRILGVSPASWGHATMGIFTAGGTVFNAATTDWAHGLAADPVVATITRNVLRRLGDLGAPAKATHPRLWATLHSESVRFGWEGNASGPSEITLYAIDGRRVIGLPIPAGNARGALTWDGNDVHGRRATNGMYMVRLVGPTGSATAKVLLIR